MVVINIETHRREEAIDITGKVREIIKRENFQDGLIFIYVPHTTAGIFINEGADPDVQRDIMETLKKIVPSSFSYSHMEGNSPAHIKSTIVGCHTLVGIEKGELLLGVWQKIFFAEFDGPRSRKSFIKFLKNIGG